MNEKSFDTLSRMADFLNGPNANTTREAINGIFKLLDKRAQKLSVKNNADNFSKEA